MSAMNWRSWLLPAALAILLVNGRVAESLAGVPPSGLPWVAVGPFELAAVIVGFGALWQGRAHLGDTLVPGSILVAASIVPSALVGWTGLTVGSVIAAWRMPRVRSALLLFAGVAICHLMASPTFRLVTAPLQAAEAKLVAAVASSIVGPATSSSNLVLLSDGRSLVILPGCSVLATAGPALLGWLALRVWRRQPVSAAWPSALLLLGLLLLLNTARMVGMCVGQDWYHSLHEGVGATAIDLLAVALVFLTAQPWRTEPSP
ncbi:MAG: hypothetical protein U1E45_21480 [Geminicoccaceae bacterium]